MTEMSEFLDRIDVLVFRGREKFSTTMTVSVVA